MPIKNIIIHFLKKESQEKESAIIPRDSVLSVNPQTELLLEKILKAYNAKTDKLYSSFDQQNSLFQSKLSGYLNDGADFVEFTSQAMALLKSELDKSNLSTGGFIIFLHYTVSMTEFFMALMINNSEGMKVDDQMNLDHTRYLDIGKLHLACRINLSEWALNQQSDRYISFVKGKSPQKISDYFRNFIGIEENDYNPKADNDNLVDALDNYSSQSELSIEEMQENKKKAYQYCQQQAKDGNLIELNELSSAINEASPKDFSDYIKAEPYSIEQQLLPDRKSLRQILRYNGFSPGMRISFDKALLGYSVFYDKNTDTLTIKGIPDNLRDQLT